MAWATSFATPDALDRWLVLRINPRQAIPGLDAAMILVTDFSIPYLATMIGLAGLGAELRHRGWIAARTTARALRALGFALAIWVAAHFAPSYAHPAAPLAMAPLVAGTLWWIGGALAACDDATLRQVRTAAWLAAASLAVAEVSLDLAAELGRQRPRPFAPQNAAWNQALRVVRDEYVRRRSGYPSGHAVAIFALATPLLRAAPRRAIGVAALALALACAYSRLYVAAHFPSDVVMGAAMGSGIAALVGEALAPRAGERTAPTR